MVYAYYLQRRTGRPPLYLTVEEEHRYAYPNAEPFTIAYLSQDAALCKVTPLNGTNLHQKIQILGRQEGE
jgi:hypothetical protein